MEKLNCNCNCNWKLNSRKTENWQVKLVLLNKACLLHATRQSARWIKQGVCRLLRPKGHFIMYILEQFGAIYFGSFLWIHARIPVFKFQIFLVFSFHLWKMKQELKAWQGLSLHVAFRAAVRLSNLHNISPASQTSSDILRHVFRCAVWSEWQFSCSSWMWEVWVGSHTSAWYMRTSEASDPTGKNRALCASSPNSSCGRWHGQSITYLLPKHRCPICVQAYQSSAAVKFITACPSCEAFFSQLAHQSSTCFSTTLECVPCYCLVRFVNLH